MSRYGKSNQIIILAMILFVGVSCSHTFPEDQLVQELRALCLKEYGIEHVDVKIVGKTIGVHLPLDKLFAVDFSSFANGEIPVQDIESLLQFSPDAMDKVENVLFSTSRVILSTDKDIDFYVLTATDTQSTGIQLLLAGYVKDLKRVRFWDISRDEYRKRIANDLRINRGVIWKKPVAKLFEDMETSSTTQLLEKYFAPRRSVEDISPLFYSELLELGFKKNIKNEILEIKSTSIKKDEIVVYAKVRSTFRPVLEYVDYDFLIPSGYEAEYIFILSYKDDKYLIDRVIPFHFVDETEQMERVEFPEDLGLYKNIDTWLEDFIVEEIFLPDFLAQQVTRRVQQLMLEDERVVSTFEDVRIDFAHIQEDDTDSEKEEGRREVDPSQPHKPGHFRLSALVTPKSGDVEQSLIEQDLFADKDVRYLLDKALTEFVSVLRSYRFEDFEYLDIVSPKLEEILVLNKDDLELYRQHKLPLVDLVKTSYTI